MRKLIVAGVSVTALALPLWTVRQTEPPSPSPPTPWPYGYDIFAEPECAAAARNRPPALVWTATDVSAKDAISTSISDIRLRMVGQKVRLAGVLDVESESTGLFSTSVDADRAPRNAVRVGVGALWSPEAYWVTKARMVADGAPWWRGSLVVFRCLPTWSGLALQR